MVGVLVALVLMSHGWDSSSWRAAAGAGASTISRVKARDAFRRQRQLAVQGQFLPVRAPVRRQRGETFFGQGTKRPGVREIRRHVAQGQSRGKCTSRHVPSHRGSCWRPAPWPSSSGTDPDFHASEAVSLGTLIAFINLVRMFYKPRHRHFGKIHDTAERNGRRGEGIQAAGLPARRIEDDGERPLSFARGPAANRVRSRMVLSRTRTRTGF
jgi:hypothetical protein